MEDSIIIILTMLAFIYTQIRTITMDHGSLAKQMVLANLVTFKVCFAKDSGSMMCNMDMDSNTGLMELFLEGISIKDQRKRESLSGQMEVLMRESLRKTNLMGRAFFSGKTKECMKVNGRTT